MLLEEDLSELIEAAPPALPLVSGLRRYIESSVHADLFEIVSRSSWIRTVSRSFDLTAAIAHENVLYVLLETSSTCDVLWRNDATAEHTYPREGGRICKGDGAGLHATH